MSRNFENEEPRLERLLGEVAGRIPEADREILRGRLRSVRAEPIRGAVLANAMFVGYLTFDPVKLAAYTDGAVMAVMAHELAHVLLHYKDDDLSLDEREEQAYDQARQWGFVEEVTKLFQEAHELEREA